MFDQSGTFYWQKEEEDEDENNEEDAMNDDDRSCSSIHSKSTESGFKRQLKVRDRRKLISKTYGKTRLNIIENRC